MDLNFPEGATFNFEYDGEDFTIPLLQHMLRGCEWRPASGQPEFVLIFVHGLGSFVTANHDFADVILANGGSFVACDHLGHGRSPGPRCSCTIDEICDETELVLQKARDSFPDIPIFLYGSSMGCLAGLQIVFEKSVLATRYLRGVILACPWISNSKAKPITLFQSVGIMIAAHIFPSMILATGHESSPPDAHPDFAKKFHDCPLYSPFTTPRLLDSALRTITKVRARFGDWPSDLPVLFLQGALDTSVDPVANHAWFRAVWEASAKDLVEIKIYEQATHNLLKGPYRSSVLQDIVEFINKLKQ
jgi:acylglycerol lipase